MRTYPQGKFGIINNHIELWKIHRAENEVGMPCTVEGLFILDYLKCEVHNTSQVLQRETVEHNVRVHMLDDPH